MERTRPSGMWQEEPFSTTHVDNRVATALLDVAAPRQLVAIGGIGLANAAAVREAGATSAAVVRALADSPEASSPEVILHAWRAHWTG